MDTVATTSVNIRKTPEIILVCTYDYMIFTAGDKGINTTMKT